MSHGTDYQRYKHKLDRLQSKVKRSENARKELELRLQRLMKERNDSEKSASIHKSKYNTLLRHERTRLSRNGELLQMLEDVQTKAANLASNTERLKMLKNQQERILINNWRRNACLQQQMFYPNVIYPNTVQYVLPPPPPPPPPPQPLPPQASSSSLSSQPPVISLTSLPQDYQNSATINSSVPSVKPLIPVHGNAAYFVENPHEVYASTSIQSFIDTANIGTHQQHPPTISQQPLKLSSSLMPVYHSEPFHPLYNNVYIRSHEPQQLSFQETAYIPNRRSMDMPKLHIEHGQSVHDKNINSMHSLYESLATPRIGHRPLDNPRYPLHLNKSQQYSHQYHSPAIEPLNRTINQFSFDDASTSSQINIPSTHLSKQINEPKTGSKTKSNTEPSIYDDSNVTDMFGNQMNTEREMFSNPSDIDSMYQYERNKTNDKWNEPFKGDRNNDVYANDDNGFKSDSHIESTERKLKSISNTNTTSISNETPLAMSTTTTAAAAAASITSMTTPSKYITDIAMKNENENENEIAQHIPYSGSTSTFDDVSNVRDHYPYENISDRTYTSVHPKESNDDSIDRAHIDNSKRMALERSSSHALFPSDNQQKIFKRRSSIDADSFAKTLGHDTNSERESIAANIRRRYSVAANFLNLPSNAANDTNSFNFTPTVSATEYQNNTRAWVNNNNSSTPRANAIVTDHIDTIRTHGNDNGDANGLTNKSPFDTNSMARIDNNRNGSAIIAPNQIDVPIVSSVSHTLPIESNDGYMSQQSNIVPSQHNDENINQYDNGTTAYPTTTYGPMDDQTYVENAMEQLKLDGNSERIQFDDSADRIRASGKTVTWADDPESNYKKQDTANMYEVQNMANVDNSSADAYYANHSDSQQQQQPHIQQHDYVTTDGNGTAAGTNESPHYQYDGSNQYDNGQYQYNAPDAVGANDDYYYGTEQMNQYNQYVAQPEVQPQQQEDTQQMQYYAADAANLNDGSVNDGYQQKFQTETTLQVQPKQDEYYTVSPGENYYTDYESVNQAQTYAVPPNAAVSNMTGVEKHKPIQPQQQKQQQQQQKQQQQKQQQQQSRSNLPTQNEAIRVPNYLQSDTDDSQISYQNQTANAAPQSQDSDFDFSINS